MKKPIELSNYSDGVNSLKVSLLYEYLKHGNCLDVGCGNGLYGYNILERCTDLLQIDVLDRRSVKAIPYPFLAMDANKLDFPATTINNVVAFDIMEHLDDDIAFCQKVHNLCTRNGRFILSVPNKDDTQPRIMGLTHMHHIDKTHRREYSKQDLLLLLENNGFKVLEIRPHYNKGILSVGKALAKQNIISRLFAKFLYLQIRSLVWIGIFENRCIADWFCVAEVK